MEYFPKPLGLGFVVRPQNQTCKSKITNNVMSSSEIKNDTVPPDAGGKTQRAISTSQMMIRHRSKLASDAMSDKPHAMLLWGIHPKAHTIHNAQAQAQAHLHMHTRGLLRYTQHYSCTSAYTCTWTSVGIHMHGSIETSVANMMS
jgi:hypothetical protein